MKGKPALPPPASRLPRSLLSFLYPLVAPHATRPPLSLLYPRTTQPLPSPQPSTQPSPPQPSTQPSTQPTYALLLAAWLAPLLSPLPLPLPLPPPASLPFTHAAFPTRSSSSPSPSPSLSLPLPSLYPPLPSSALPPPAIYPPSTRLLPLSVFPMGPWTTTHARYFFCITHLLLPLHYHLLPTWNSSPVATTRIRVDKEGQNWQNSERIEEVNLGSE